MRRSQAGLSTPRWSANTGPRADPLPISLPVPSPLVSQPISSSSESCFLVLFAKRSNKKRKSFADGVLEVTPAKWTLFDMEGKQVSSTRNTCQVGLGDELEVGANSVEVSSQVPYSDFTSKQVFSKPAPSPTAPVPTATVAALPKFNRVMEAKPAAGRPAFNPASPNALVLRQPVSNPDGSLQSVAIVVDPNLACRLRPHQKDGVQFLFNSVMGIGNAPECFGCILADEMGLGKTLQSITVIWTLLKQSKEGLYSSPPLVRKCVIVCPANLVGNWQREFEKFLGPVHLLPICITESGLKAEKDVAEFCQTRLRNVLIISFESYRKHEEWINACTGFDLLIVDEGHRLKSSSGNKTISALAASPTRRRILLTGTPLQNQLDEFYSLVNFVNPLALQGDVKSFRREFQVPIERGRDKDATEEEIATANERSNELAQLTRAFILRRTAEINQLLLPPKRETLVFIRLSAVQERLYRNLIASREVQSLLNSASESTGGTDALRLIMRLKQLCTHPLLLGGSDDGGEELDLVSSSPKFQVLDELLGEIRSRDKTDRIVLVSCYTASLDLMAKLCDARQYKYLRMDGKTKVKERQQLVNQFNAPATTTAGPFVFLLSAKAGGCGINLVGANRLVLMDADWNPAVDLQAMARVWRDGQTKDVHVYRFLSTGSIEERVFQRQLMKIQTGLGIVGSAKFREQSSEFSRLELKQLFELHAGVKCDTFDLMSNGEEDEGGVEGWADYNSAEDVQGDEVLRQVATKLGDQISFIHSELFSAESLSSSKQQEESDLRFLDSEEEEVVTKPKRSRKVVQEEEEDEL
ncbi:hypothetical protein BASA81_012355 [Batrachochytrium salamandrivorans]|nr:hypothetical protein BASA81_012355 [Batrachochytrium salamandrivorans]